MSQALKEQRNALKINLAKAIITVLTNNPHLKDKKVIKAIDKAATNLAKKVTKANKPTKKVKVVKAKTSVKKVDAPKKVVAKTSPSVAVKKAPIKKTIPLK